MAGPTLADSAPGLAARSLFPLVFPVGAGLFALEACTGGFGDVSPWVSAAGCVTLGTAGIDVLVIGSRGRDRTSVALHCGRRFLGIAALVTMMLSFSQRPDLGPAALFLGLASMAVDLWTCRAVVDSSMPGSAGLVDRLLRRPLNPKADGTADPLADALRWMSVPRIVALVISVAAVLCGISLGAVAVLR